MIRSENSKEIWETEKHLYQEFGIEVVKELKSLIKNLGIYAETSSRVKETDSLMKKMYVKNKSYEEVHDKVGARAIVQFKSDLIKLDDEIMKKFGNAIVHREDKAQTLSEFQFGYQSIHYDLKKGDNMYCELQIRTVCQHNWSMMSHSLSYKKENIPINIKRQINALSALFEVADNQFQNIFDLITDLPIENEMRIYNRLVFLYQTLTSKSFRAEMTHEFLNFSKEVYSKPEEIIMCIENFIKENSDKLEDTINDSNSNFYYSQPEILLILERLSNKKILLKKRWIKLYPLELLEKIAADWGISLD